VLAAKFAVYTAVGAVFGLMLAVTAVIATAVAITANGGALDLSNSDLWRTLAGGVACNAVFAAIGVSLGALIPNLATAIATALAWIALVEGLIGELLSDLEAWLPFAGGQALGRLPGAPDISQWAGGLLLAGYAVVFAAIALTTSVRRGITEVTIRNHVPPPWRSWGSIGDQHGDLLTSSLLEGVGWLCGTAEQPEAGHASSGKRSDLRTSTDELGARDARHPASGP
jgi:hypothetical protein